MFKNGGIEGYEFLSYMIFNVIYAIWRKKCERDRTRWRKNGGFMEIVWKIVTLLSI